MIIIVVNERSCLSSQFSRFAELECGNAPLYRALATAAAKDPELLDIAAAAEHGPVPNLFLAAVHELLLREHGEGVSQFYPTLTTDSLSPSGAADAMREFVLEFASEIRHTLRYRLVQTNEVRRASVLFLALAWLSGRYGASRIGLVEVGASAGLLLAFDRYEYSFARRASEHTAAPGFEIATELIGGRLPGYFDPPEVIERVGIDLNILDMHDEDDRRWLRALVWGDQPERMAMLERAIDAARGVPMTLLEGDANQVLPGVLERWPPSLPIVIYHSHTLNQFPTAARERFEQILGEASRARDVYRIAMEYEQDEPTLTAMAYREGSRSDTTRLARYDAHGGWIRWLDS